MEQLNFSTGVVEMAVNSGRVIRFNPADIGFLETLYALIGKIDAIGSDSAKKKDKVDNPAKLFDYSRAADKRMREAVDAVFGDGFCADVFQELRLTAMADGLSVIENFLFAVVDRMDESVRDNMAKREGRIAKYTAKYEKYKK